MCVMINDYKFKKKLGIQKSSLENPGHTSEKNFQKKSQVPPSKIKIFFSKRGPTPPKTFPNFFLKS